MAFKQTTVATALAHALRALAIGGSTALLVPGTATAQVQASQPIKVEVTGSMIRRVEAEGALPVTVFRMEDLKEQGYTTVQDIINTIGANQSIVGTSGAIGGITGGAAFANLRGLGANKTLVLLNGRRIVNQAIGGAGDSSAPDLNTIPLAAIERIEVLRDGASSLYGTDAIGGVINFITRKDYIGAEVSGQYTIPEHSGGKSWEANVGFGWGDINKDKWNISGFYDKQHQDVVTTPQRDFATANKTSPTGFPGSWSQGSLAINPLAPACNGQYQAPGGTTCNYYYWNWVDLIPKTDRENGMVKGTLALPGGHQASLEYTAASTDVWTNIAPVPEGALRMFPTNYVNGVDTGIANPFYPSGANPGYVNGTNPLGQIGVRYRTIPAGPRADHNETFQDRFVAALEGRIAGWDYNAGFTYSTIKTSDTLIGGYVDDSLIREAVAAGRLNPFTADLPADQQAIVQSAVLPGKLFDAKGTTYTWDLRTSRELADWFGSGSNSALALGAEWRHEKFEQIANGFGDPNSYPARVVSSTGFDPNTNNQGDRNIWAVYGELNMPILKSLEVTASVRYDHYPDFGSTTNPKISARYQPSPTWLIRGSAATGFRAPSLYELHSAQTFTNTANNWDDPVRCPGGVPVAGVSPSDNCAVQFMALTGGNPQLTPEKSRSATVGFVLQPAPQFDASVDFWWVHLRNSIGALSDSTVFTDPAAYAGHFVRAPNDGSLATDGSLCNTAADPGPQCGYVVLLNDNLGEVSTNGIDLAANWRFTTGVGKLTFGLQDTYVFKYQFQTEKDGPWFSALGQYGNIPGTTGGAPVFRNQLTLTGQWSRGPWTLGVVNHFRSGYLDEDVGQEVIQKVGSYSTWDVYGSWAPTKQLTVTAGVKNVMDTDPPHTEQAATFQVGYDPRFADPLGRAYYMRLQYKFF